MLIEMISIDRVTTNFYILLTFFLLAFVVMGNFLQLFEIFLHLVPMLRRGSDGAANSSMAFAFTKKS